MTGHIRERSPGSWELRYPLPAGSDGKRRTGTKTVRGGRKEAEKALRAAMVAVDRQDHVDPNRITVAALVRHRIEAWQASGKIGARCAENYEDLLKLIDKGVGSIRLQALTMADVESWHIAMRQQGAGVRSVRVAHALLARALRDAVGQQMITRNVARDQGPPMRQPSAEVVVPNIETVGRIIAGLAADREWRVPVIVALYCGLRRSEQLALRWCNVDFDRAQLTVAEALDETRAGGVRVKAPKTEAGRRTISLPAIVVDALRQHRQQQLEQRMVLGLGKPADDALVFPNIEGKHQGPRSFSVRWGRVAARLGVPEITWHSLRHAAASMLIAQKGVEVTMVAARLGHANPSVTLSIYARLFEKDDRKAADALDALGLFG